MNDDDRLAELEKQVRDLRARVVSLERLVGTTVAEHPADSVVVQKKTVYDWQK
jgi:hypothetical protein